MNAVDDPFQRLQKLGQILSHAVTLGGGVSGDPGRALEEQKQRIGRLTTELHDGSGTGNDEIDTITMRLLLIDYVSLVASLRATTRDAEMRLIAAHGVIKTTRRRFDRQEKLRLKHERRRASA